MTIETPTINFTKVVERAGIPTNEDAWMALFRKDLEDQGGIIANDAPYSPFWRVISAIVAKPATWMVNKILIETILPNLFLQTAKDNEFIEAKAWEHGLTRKPQESSQGHVTFYRAANVGPSLLISAGTLVQTDAINGTVYRVISNNDVIMPENETSVLVPVTAENPGEDYNLGAGYYHVLSEAVTGISTVSNNSDWIDVLGANAETNDELKLRTRNAFTASAGWHIDAVYLSILTERSGLNNDNIFFEHEAPRGAGTANAYVLLDLGEPSTELIADLNNYINDKGHHGHGDDMQVFAMPSTSENITITIYPHNNFSEDEVTILLAEVENYIRCAFRENNDYNATKTVPNSRFSFSRLGQELHKEFSGINSLGWGQGDITSKHIVPRLNSLIITNGTH